MPDTNTIVIESTPYTIESITSKTITNIFIKRTYKPPTALDKWFDEFPFLNDDDFTNYFSLPNKIAHDSKLQVFQYKILNKIIASQENLMKWGISDHNQCSRCACVENSQHLFFYCKTVRSFWKSIESWIANSFNTQINLSIIDILFGVPGRTDTMFLYINFIIIHAKYYLFKCKCEESDIFVLTFLIYLKYYVHIEHYIESLKADTLDNKWNLLVSKI